MGEAMHGGRGPRRERLRSIAARVEAGCIVAALVAVALLVASAGARAASEPEADAQATRARMRKIFASMRVLLPLSVNDEAFAATANRPTVTKALQALADNADALAAHARTGDAGRRYLGQSLAHDARSALERYQDGRTDSAAFLVQQATENCIACHTKLASPGDSPLSTAFVEKSALAGLPPEERARMEIATRQFDDALTTLEAVFASPAIHPATLLGPLTDYLIVSIRVKGDLQRPVPVLEKLSRRDDLWMQLRQDVEQWIADLRARRATAAGPPDLPAARALMKEANELSPFATDQSGLVRYIVASSLLHRFLAGPPAPPEQQSEAWYLLGVCELRTSDTYWLSQADLYLERAIRVAPRTPSARQAYALLEAETLEGYTGTAGTHVPPSVAHRLDELRALVGPGKK
jgi:tetratricopeptide (TPR) repeat protein